MRKYGTSDDQQLITDEVEADPQGTGISRTATSQQWTETDREQLAQENSTDPQPETR